jgi:hypothetical protein
MTIEELKKELNKFPPDCQIIYPYNSDYAPLSAICARKMHDFGGWYREPFPSDTDKSTEVVVVIC